MGKTEIDGLNSRIQVKLIEKKVYHLYLKRGGITELYAKLYYTRDPFISYICHSKVCRDFKLTQNSSLVSWAAIEIQFFPMNRTRIWFQRSELNLNRTSWTLRSSETITSQKSLNIIGSLIFPLVAIHLSNAQPSFHLQLSLTSTLTGFCQPSWTTWLSIKRKVLRSSWSNWRPPEPRPQHRSSGGQPRPRRQPRPRPPFQLRRRRGGTLWQSTPRYQT